ncbi:MAG TPA: hypothetical protein PLK94_01175 [Alphaproteobacteria bacterium]|nr:hypothetical protein [Alphaproteobacteria bacterium]
MCGHVRDIEKWIETSNCFEVMGQLRKLDVLSTADLEAAMKMTRGEWLVFMRLKVGLEPRIYQKQGRDYEKKEKEEIQSE